MSRKADAYWQTMSRLRYRHAGNLAVDDLDDAPEHAASVAERFASEEPSLTLTSDTLLRRSWNRPLPRPAGYR